MSLRGNGALPLLVSPEAETALILANPAHVWWPENCTVVTAAMSEDMETLPANWSSMRWPAGMRRFLSTEGTEDTETNTEVELLSRPFAPLPDSTELLSAKDAKTREKLPCPSVWSVGSYWLTIANSLAASFLEAFPVAPFCGSTAKAADYFTL